MHEAEVIGSFSCSIHHWLLDQKSAFLLYPVCMASAICKQLEKKRATSIFRRVFSAKRRKTEQLTNR
jgi:drug/metabolite transporter superfamily protein YnfA